LMQSVSHITYPFSTFYLYWMSSTLHQSCSLF
jgi:hypothetical protein